MAFERGKVSKRSQLLGVPLKDHAHLHLKLYAALIEATMSEIVKDLVYSYLEDKPSKKEIIKLMAKKAHKEWDKLCLDNFGKKEWSGVFLSRRYQTFTKKASANLSKRGVPKDVIEIIISEIDKLEIDR